MITVADDKLSIAFDRFGLDEYQVFLRSKQLPESEIVFDAETETYRLCAPARFAALFGVKAPQSARPWMSFPTWMHDYQAELCQRALDAKRWAHWWDCGLGKGPEGLEWCRQVAHATGGRVLILTLKELIGSMLSERDKFYGKGDTDKSNEDVARGSHCQTARDDQSTSARSLGYGVQSAGGVASQKRAHAAGRKGGAGSGLEKIVGGAADVAGPRGKRQVTGRHSDHANSSASARIELRVLKTRSDLVEFCKGPRDGSIGITNYEKFIDQSDAKNSGIILELKWLAGLWADESSILKSGGGVIKWNLIKSARGIEYKLSTTATPAPNDIMEYASQAAFLEKIRTESDVLWTYFQRDKTGAWKVRPHALQAFYRFMSSWSIYLRNPARYGWKDNLKSIPAPLFIEHKIDITSDQERRKAKVIADFGLRNADLNADVCDKPLGIVGRTKLSQLAKGFIYQSAIRNPQSAMVRTAARVMSKKPGVVARIAADETAAGRQVLIWTQFDEESAILSELRPGAAVLTGSTKPADRAAIITKFKRGELRELITRAELLGFGQNFQMCEAMIFSAFTDSYEDFYQAVRRSYRYGQTKSVRIHIPFIPELEGAIWNNLARKAANFERDTETQEMHYIEAMKAAA